MRWKTVQATERQRTKISPANSGTSNSELKFPTTIMETWISELRYPTPVVEQRTLNSWTSNTSCGTWNSDELRYPSANNGTWNFECKSPFHIAWETELRTEALQPMAILTRTLG